MNIKHYTPNTEFGKLRYKYLESLNNLNSNEEIWWQIPGTRLNKWLDFYSFTEHTFTFYNSMLRTPLNNEIVIDIDKKIYNEDKTFNLEKSIIASCEVAVRIIKKMKNEISYYSLYYSGNKGFHIHILIKNFKILDKSKFEVFKLKDENSNLFFKTLKESFLKYFNIEIGLNSEDAVDPCLLKKKQLLRTEGSKHSKSNFWKSYIDTSVTGLKVQDILNEVRNFMDKTNINFNYIKEGNILSEKMTNFIFNYIKEEFTKKLRKSAVVSKYENKSKRTINIQKYLNLFKKLYLPGNRFIVGGAVISFLYIFTKKDKDKAQELYYNNFRELSEDNAETQFFSRFERTWETCEQQEKVGFYHLLESSNIITKEKFKERLNENE
jgi:hypothetical protein